MDISNIVGASGSATASSRTTIAENFDTFLTLLTAQLRHQNPLDPLDTNQFTSQLVQFTAVEQQLKTNEYLEALILTSQNTNTSNAVALIGKEIAAEGAETVLADGQAAWAYDAERAVDSATITVRDAMGAVVHTRQQSLPTGAGTFLWDGRDEFGNAMPEGTYTLSIDARDAEGHRVAVGTQMSGRVESVDLTGPVPVLVVGGVRVPLANVTAVHG